MKKIISFFKSMRISTIYKIVGIILFIGIMIWIISTINKSEIIEENANKIITGTITNKGNNYIIVKDKNNKEYLIHGVEEENYTIGSEIDANVNQVIDNSQNIETEEKIPTTITSNNINITYENIYNQNADTEVMNYFNETNNYFNNINFQEEIKARFIILVDFLFYNGKIKGHTLDDLSNEAKLTVLDIAIEIDNKIENYLPGYKESISNTGTKVYTGVKTKIIDSYFTITAKVCSFDQNLCNSAKENFQEMKSSFAITWNVIKDLVDAGKDNMKTWYEIYSGN